VDHRDVEREDARSLSSGRALRGPVGAFARWWRLCCRDAL